jgi:hypothetical protein
MRSARPAEHQVITIGDLSANITSLITNVEHRDRVLYNFIWNTGAALDSEIFIEWTNDERPDANTVWNLLDFGSPILISGVSGNHQVIINLITWKNMRARTVFTAGTGNLNAFIKSAAQGV